MCNVKIVYVCKNIQLKYMYLAHLLLVSPSNKLYKTRMTKFIKTKLNKLDRQTINIYIVAAHKTWQNIIFG